ncbi:MAG: hypothetical protein ACFB10_10460 [Salibacteraceae bacterium]
MNRLLNTWNQQGARLISLGDQALVSGTNFLLGIALVRSLGLDGYGRYVLLWMGVQVASSFLQALVVAPLQHLWPVQPVSESKKGLQILDGQAVLLALLGGILCAVLGWWINLPPALCGATAIAYLLHDYYRKRAFAQQRPQRAFLLDATATGIVLGGLGYFTAQNDFQLYQVCYFLVLAYSIPLLPTLLGPLHWISPKVVLEEMWAQRQYTGWLAGTALLQWFSGNFFLIAAGTVLGPAALGALRMAQQLVGLLHVLFLAFKNQIPAPAAKVLESDGRHGLMHFMLKASRMLWLGCGAFLLLLFLAAPQILTLVFGTEHTGYANLLRGYCAIYVLVALGTPLRITLRALQQTKILFIGYVMNALLGFMLATPIVTAFGTTGVLLGLAGSQILLLTAYCWPLRHQLGQHLTSHAYRSHSSR